MKETIVNNNRIYFQDGSWIMESADGSWNGCFICGSFEEAVEYAEETSAETYVEDEV